MLEKFESMSIFANSTRVREGFRDIEGTIQSEVNVYLEEAGTLVGLSIGDVISVEATLHPYVALMVGEALINAGLNVYFRAGGPLNGQLRPAPIPTAKRPVR